jgi:disulfide bond formation protein DsbB
MARIKLTFEKTNQLALLLALGMLGLIIFFQIQRNLPSCALSNIERILLLVLAISFWGSLKYSHIGHSRHIFAWSSFLVSAGGIVTTMRHLWIQRLPSSTILSAGTRIKEVSSSFSANNPLNFFIPFIEKLKTIYFGIPSGCHQVCKIFFGIRLTEVLLAAFVLFAIISFWQQYRHNERKVG